MQGKANRRIIFSRLMVGEPKPENFEFVEEPVPEPGGGELLLRNLYVSFDPGSRSRLSGRDSYVPAKPVGEVMDTQSVSEVVRSNHPDYRPGEIVAGVLEAHCRMLLSERASAGVVSERRPAACGGPAIG